MEDMSELIKQFSSMLNKNSSEEAENSSISPAETNSSDPKKDFSINPETLSTIASMLNNSSASGEKEGSSLPNMDIEMIMKLKTMMDKMNSKEDPRSKLLLALKPYLKESRKSKLDQYIQFMNMSKIIDILKPTGGEKSK